MNKLSHAEREALSRGLTYSVAAIQSQHEPSHFYALVPEMKMLVSAENLENLEQTLQQDILAEISDRAEQGQSFPWPWQKEKALDYLEEPADAELEIIVRHRPSDSASSDATSLT